MSIESLKNALPPYAKDLKLNLSSILREPGLSDLQIWGTAVSCAVASRNPIVTSAILAEAKKKLNEDELNAAKGAAAIMGMNNIFYRFRHLINNDDYSKIPARLRMQIIGKPGVEKADFELWSLAVSAITGCGTCIESHENSLQSLNIKKEVVLHAIRIASVIHAIAVVLASPKEPAS